MLEQFRELNDLLVHTSSILLPPADIKVVVGGAVLNVFVPVDIGSELHHILQVPWDFSFSVHGPAESFFSGNILDPLGSSLKLIPGHNDHARRVKQEGVGDVRSAKSIHDDVNISFLSLFMSLNHT